MRVVAPPAAAPDMRAVWPPDAVAVTRCALPPAAASETRAVCPPDAEPLTRLETVVATSVFHLHGVNPGLAGLEIDRAGLAGLEIDARADADEVEAAGIVQMVARDADDLKHGRERPVLSLDPDLRADPVHR